MSQSGIGVEFAGDMARIARIQNVDTGPCVTLRTVPIIDVRNSIGRDESPVTIATDDRSSNVRIVRPAIVGPELERDAAEYEARVAMLGKHSDHQIDVNHIGNADDPRAWLAVSTHSRTASAAVEKVSENLSSVSALHIPRSVALGRGYIFGCDTKLGSTAVVIQPYETASSICFVNGCAIVGTAQLRGLPQTESNDAALAAWFAELQMIAQYRLSTDLLATVGSGDSQYVWAGEPNLAAKFRDLTGAEIIPANPQVIDFSPESETSLFTADWLVALGAALN